MAKQLEKAISLAEKHKAALNELNAALGQSVVRPWEKLYVDYYNGVTTINIFQEAEDSKSLFLHLFGFHSPSLQTLLLPPSGFILLERIASMFMQQILKQTSLRHLSSSLDWNLKSSATSYWQLFQLISQKLPSQKLQTGRQSLTL